MPFSSLGCPPDRMLGSLKVVAELAAALRFGDLDSTGLRTTPAAAAGFCLPLLVQGGERRFYFGVRPAACAALLKIVLVLNWKPGTNETSRCTRVQPKSVGFLKHESKVILLNNPQ